MGLGLSSLPTPLNKRRVLSPGYAPSRVLETGAGTRIVTRHLRDLLPATTRLTATDLNPPMLDVARKKFRPDEPIATGWRGANRDWGPFNVHRVTFKTSRPFRRANPIHYISTLLRHKRSRRCRKPSALRPHSKNFGLDAAALRTAARAASESALPQYQPSPAIPRRLAAPSLGRNSRASNRLEWVRQQPQ